MDNSSFLAAPEATVLSSGGSELNLPTGTLSSDWYIRVKASLQETTAPSSLGVQTIDFDLDQQVSFLHSTLQTSLELPGIELLPERFIKKSEEGTDKSRTRYCLIGLPTMLSSQIGQARQIVRAWEGVEAKKEKRKVQTKFVKREVILQQDLKPDRPIEDFSSPEVKNSQSETKRTGETFKKLKGSNPAQIRKQFLQHAMGGDASELQPGKTKTSTGKLRPPKDVLNRLIFDGGCKVEDYVVGYIDRHAGILEKPVAEWQEYEEQNLIAYFKYVPDDEIVWDRMRKIDWVFNKLPG